MTPVTLEPISVRVGPATASSNHRTPCQEPLLFPASPPALPPFPPVRQLDWTGPFLNSYTYYLSYSQCTFSPITTNPKLEDMLPNGPRSGSEAGLPRSVRSRSAERSQARGYDREPPRYADAPPLPSSARSIRPQRSLASIPSAPSRDRSRPPPMPAPARSARDERERERPRPSYRPSTDSTSSSGSGSSGSSFLDRMRSNNSTPRTSMDEDEYAPKPSAARRRQPVAERRQNRPDRRHARDDGGADEGRRERRICAIAWLDAHIVCRIAQTRCGGRAR
jgi:hypothetical protein